MMRRLSAAALMLLLVATLVAAWLWQDFQRFLATPLKLPETGLVYDLRVGTSLGRLADDLERRGVLANALYLRALARWKGQAANLQAGEYRIAVGTRPEILLEQMVLGQVTDYSITFVEGWTFRQLLAALAGHEVLEPSLTGLDQATIMERLGHPGEHPEGRFFPDTYHFPRGTSDLQILERAYRTMEGLLAREWEQRAEDLPLADPYQALILASIVERETGVASERPRIAGVFVRRLRRGMKLQTDPTIIYGMGERYDGNIRRRDLQEDTPYNTYVHAGLTPTPICMPGAEAIRAALHPVAGNDLYFVARGDGSHEFSPSLKLHNAAVRKYQLGAR